MWKRHRVMSPTSLIKEILSKGVPECGFKCTEFREFSRYKKADSVPKVKLKIKPIQGHI